MKFTQLVILSLTFMYFGIPDLIAQKNSNTELHLDPLFQKNDIHNLKFYGEQKMLNTYLGIQQNENLSMDLANGKLYLNINGSGILYALDSNYNYSRVDSTKYQGNYFGSAFFTYNNKIFNTGGYGFWDLTGSIRYFDTLTHEWGYLVTNKNIPFANGKNSISYFDKNAGLLYVLYVDYEPEYVSERSNDKLLKLQCYNINTQKWWDHYYFFYNKNSISLADIHFIHHTKNGILINIKDFKDTYEINFAKKSFYKIDYEFITQLFQIKEQSRNFLSFTVQDTLFFYDCENNDMKSIIFDEKSKIKVDSLLFKKEQATSNFLNKLYFIFILAIIFLVILLVIQFIHYRKRNFDTTQQYALSNVENLNFKESLDNQEIDVLKLMLDNGDLNKTTSVEELNNILGLKDKSYKIQNNIRADVINSINKKFKILTNMNDILIERKRTDFDKRFFEYYLNRKYINKISKFL